MFHWSNWRKPIIEFFLSQFSWNGFLLYHLFIKALSTYLKGLGVLLLSALTSSLDKTYLRPISSSYSLLNRKIIALFPQPWPPSGNGSLCVLILLLVVLRLIAQRVCWYFEAFFKVGCMLLLTSQTTCPQRDVFLGVCKLQLINLTLWDRWSLEAVKCFAVGTGA